jgi:hypothetical protein
MDRQVNYQKNMNDTASQETTAVENLKYHGNRKIVNTNVNNTKLLEKMKLKIISLNTNSFYKNMFYINLLLETYDIVCIQETMVLHEDKYKTMIYNNTGTHHFYSIEAQMNAKQGRPSGGMCCFIKKGIPHIYSAHDRNKMVIKIRGTALIFVYLPNEGKGHYEFKKELKSLEFIMENTIQKTMEPYLFGDLNIDFSRSKSKNVKVFNNFIHKFKLIPYDMVFIKGKKVTRYKGDEKSWIDHVLARETNSKILKVNILDDKNTMDQNSSDHHPIEFILRISYDDNHANKRTSFKKDIDDSKLRCRWNMAKFVDFFSNEFKKYEEETAFWLNKLENAKTNTENKDTLNEVLSFIHMKLYECAKAASIKINKLIRIKKIKVESWWSKELKALNGEMRRYLSLYRRYGNKSDQINSDIIQKRFRILHRAEIQKFNYNQNMKLDKLKNNNINTFWKRIKMKLQKKIKVQVDIDELKNEFMKIFNDKLIRSDDTPFKNRVSQFKSDNDDKIYKDDISIETIEEIIKDLNSGKAIGINKCSNEMFKNTKSKIFVKLLSKFFSKILNTGIFPDDFNISIIKPLVKDGKKSPNDQSNIRPISISDTICTILEKLLLLEINKEYNDHKKQFGFKKNSSCQHALFVLNESLNANKRRHLKTYVCAIDASKAFDKVNRNKLWCKLMDRVNAKVVRALMEYYNNSAAIVANEEDTSSIFKTTIGVKQGGCLSPRLFTIYVDDVIKEIESIDAGIEIGGIKIDILLYADDMLLVTNDKLKLKKMLNIITNYGNENEIKFNGTKTTMLIYNRTKQDFTKRSKNIDGNIKLTLSGETITSTSHMKYLGCMYSDNYSLTKHWDMKNNVLAAKIAQLQQIGLHSQSLSSKTKAFIFKTFIRPLVTYGTDTFYMNSNDLKKLKELEGNCLKDSLGLFRRIHSSELFLALDLFKTADQLIKNKLKFYKRLLINDYTKEVIDNIIIDSSSYQIENSILNEVHDLIEALDDNVDENIYNKLNELTTQFNRDRQADLIWTLKNELNQQHLDCSKIELLLQAFEPPDQDYIELLPETYF